MKNLAKPLVWEEGRHEESELAYVHDFSATYLASKNKHDAQYFVAQLEIEERIVWQRTGINTLEHAKAICQEHYAESLWDNLSEKARAILEKYLNR